MGANTMSEALRQSNNNRMVERLLTAPAVAVYICKITKKSRIKKASLMNQTVSSAAGTYDIRVQRAGSTATLGASEGVRALTTTFNAEQTVNVPVELEAAAGSAGILNDGDWIFGFPSTTLTAMAGVIQLEIEPLE
ncbi:MAG: hypothetical protein AB7I42_24240 [Bradyrhizobium sp.]|uniref:hypothetical protein n=1 Tax=Bradyrhizobium sp. TaxID=376 RepID=UPI003D0CD233